MPTTTPTTTDLRVGADDLVADRSPLATTVAAMVALLVRDLTVLRRYPANFVARTLVQPLLLVFVLGYVSPKIGQVGGDDGRAVATVLLAGVLAMVVLFQGIFAVGMPLVQEFSVSREIEDRVMSPIPVRLVALTKVVAGALQGLLAAVVVFPFALVVPADRPELHAHWLVLVTLTPLAALTCAGLGLVLGTAFDPKNVMALFAILLTPVMYLGCTLYPWQALDSLRWVQAISLLNPLTYVSEGFRAAVTPMPHLTLLVVYPALLGFTAVLLGLGTRFFERRVVA